MSTKDMTKKLLASFEANMDTSYQSKNKNKEDKSANRLSFVMVRPKNAMKDNGIFVSIHLVHLNFVGSIGYDWSRADNNWPCKK